MNSWSPSELAAAAQVWWLDLLHQLNAREAGLVALLWLGALALLAVFLQKRLVGSLQETPAAPIPLGRWLRLEITHSPLFLPLKPFELLVRGGRSLARWTRRLLTRLLRRVRAENTAPATAAAPPSPLLVATLGPSFLWAGLAVAALYLLSRLLDPLLAARLELSPGLSSWHFLAVGRHPALAPYLPLEEHPYLAGLLALFFWTVLWGLAAGAIRLFHHGRLAANLAAVRDDPAVLAFWRKACDAAELYRVAPAYRRWAAWLLIVAAPLLAVAWLSLAGEPYRVAPSEVAVSLVLWTSWLLALTLSGLDRQAAAEEADDRNDAQRPPGWQEVIRHLEREHQIGEPEPFDARPAPAPVPAEDDPRTREVLSPLLAELLPEEARLWPVQRRILTLLSLFGYVHLDPPVNQDTLELGDAVSAVLEDKSGQRSRNTVVIAPEGAGKSTLALLAAANHALIHTQATLVVVRDEAREKATAELFQRTIEPSTLRWNVRVRRPGDDLMNDVSRGILPDVVVTSLHDLVVTILDRVGPFEPFLRQLGLIVVDDVESFAGPVEAHAQLAFRRLSLRLREMHDPPPQFLLLATDSTHDTPTWARSLCGIDATARYFDTFDQPSELHGNELAEQTPAEVAEPAPVSEEAVLVSPSTEADGQGADTPSDGRRHLSFRLRDFRTGNGEPPALAPLIEACETVGVPWHFRLCGDGHRDLGRGPLLLAEEPDWHVDSPEDAVVVVLQGTWSETRRERRRLRWTGRSVAERGDAVFVTVVDPDVEMTLTQLDKRFTLSPVLESLPRPVLRPPTGPAVSPHLSADLIQHWTEVGDLAQVFGTPSVRILRRLSEGGLLLCEPSRDVSRKTLDYEDRLHVRALARAIQTVDGKGEDRRHGVLPPKVSQVELTCPAAVTVRDRTSQQRLGSTDADGAHLVYYPSRIFEDARGRFIVVERASEQNEEAALSGEVLVEPLLGDEISSCRRRLHVAPAGDTRETLREAAGGAFLERDMLLIGEHPIEIELQAVSVRALHVATYHLDPVHAEVRRRRLLAKEARERIALLRLDTVALAIFPNPDPTVPEIAEAPGLTLRGARLLAAVLRALLPSVYRGAERGLGIALHLEGGEPENVSFEPPGDHLLTAREGLYLFDAEAGGNGLARAIHRDGVELLLRLARLMVERVLSLDRLHALYDEWPSRTEILTETQDQRRHGADLERQLAETRERDAATRREVLTWLDSRLRPEGGAERHRELALQYGRGGEAGEGDAIDLGRCWFSSDGAVTDLLWVKHRWRLPDFGEASLDIGFDRRTVAQARRLSTGDEVLDLYRPLFESRRLQPDQQLPDGSLRLRPHPVRFTTGGSVQTAGSGAAAEDPEILLRVHLRLWALAADALPALEPLVETLRSHVAADAGSEAAPNLVTFLAAFVQGVPYSVPQAVEAGLRPPVSTLLYRLGDCDSKSLLLALLYQLCELDAGIFVSLAERHAMTAVAAPAPDEAPDGPRLWAELDGVTYVPVESTVYSRPGEVFPESPETWFFLPLIDLPGRLAIGRDPLTSDKAEDEDRH